MKRRWLIPIGFLVAHFASPDEALQIVGTVGFWTSLVVVIALAVKADAEREAAAYAKRARRGSAEVIELRPGSSESSVKLTLRVTAEPGEERDYRSDANDRFDTTASVSVDPVYFPQIQPGKTIAIRFDPLDHTRIELGDLGRVRDVRAPG